MKSKHKLTSEDVHQGWRERTTLVRLGNYGMLHCSCNRVSQNKLRSWLDEGTVHLHCDWCNAALGYEDLCMAITTWRGNEPKMWELEYGELVSTHAKMAYEAIART